MLRAHSCSRRLCSSYDAAALLALLGDLLLSADLDATRLRLRLLRNRDREDTVREIGRQLLGIGHVGEREGALERSVAPAEPYAILVASFVAALSFDREHAVLERDLEVLLLQTGDVADE